MNAYGMEKEVLQHMISNGIEMKAKVQQRLHSLVNGGGKAPEGFDVVSCDSILYFDLSSLSWKEETYCLMYDNFNFKNKTLEYSLAIREENKELLIPDGIDILNMKFVFERFNIEFDKEYGKDVTIQRTNCIALSGTGKEEFEGIVITANECKQMNLLIYIAKIGKRLNVRCYTLFVPIVSDIDIQKQQVLSLYNKLSPKVNMWESSLKANMLRTMEMILNCNQTHQGGSDVDERETPPLVVF